MNYLDSPETERQMVESQLAMPKFILQDLISNISFYEELAYKTMDIDQDKTMPMDEFVKNFSQVWKVVVEKAQAKVMVAIAAKKIEVWGKKLVEDMEKAQRRLHRMLHGTEEEKRIAREEQEKENEENLRRMQEAHEEKERNQRDLQLAMK